MTSPDPISCRRFRTHHAAWVDLELERRHALEMERHVTACAPCSRHDTGVRRALLVMRNLPDIRASSAFESTLEARLASERVARRVAVSRHRPPTARTVAVLAASLVAMAWLSGRRPAAGVREPVIAATSRAADIAPPPLLPRPVVRSAPLRGNPSVRVVSVQRASELAWTPGPPVQPTASFGPTLVSVSYAMTATR